MAEGVSDTSSYAADACHCTAHLLDSHIKSETRLQWLDSTWKEQSCVSDCFEDTKFSHSSVCKDRPKLSKAIGHRWIIKIIIKIFILSFISHPVSEYTNHLTSHPLISLNSIHHHHFRSLKDSVLQGVSDAALHVRHTLQCDQMISLLQSDLLVALVVKLHTPSVKQGADKLAYTSPSLAQPWAWRAKEKFSCRTLIASASCPATSFPAQNPTAGPSRQLWTPVLCFTHRNGPFKKHSGSLIQFWYRLPRIQYENTLAKLTCSLWLLQSECVRVLNESTK